MTESTDPGESRARSAARVTRIRRDDLWTDDELRAATLAYRAMQARDRAGKHVDVRAVIESLKAGPLSNRTLTSISRRMQNISAVLGDLGESWMLQYPPLDHVGVNVRPRLAEFLRGESGDGTPAVFWIPPPQVRVVPVGSGAADKSYDVPSVPPRVARRLEHALVGRYVEAVRRKGRSIVSHRYTGGLQCDAFDETLNVLIEAKAAARREFARMAVGQLLDYRRYEDGDPRLALLVPERPARGTLEFLAHNRVEVIWEHAKHEFDDTAGGAFT